MATDPRVIQLELTAIAGALTLANNTLKRVQGQIPPGPPVVPDQSNSLRTIADLATQISTLGTDLLTNGGTAPVGTPGPVGTPP